MDEGEKGKLLACWRRLGPKERESLLLFAEFLVSRQQEQVEEAPVSPDPLPIAKPPRETAVAGLKRLKRTYPMIEADMELLGSASQILMTKILGASDEEVVSKLEALFADEWKKWRAKRGE